MCVDRDNDIGEKAKIEGPIVGEEENLKAARELALADPEDTDVNAIFQAVKTARELKTEVATLTGDRDVGIVSDEKIAKQLDELLERLKPEAVVLVTDGAEDEQLIPVIQSRVRINSVKTVIVRQSKELEKAYFTITNFMKEVEKDPNISHMMFGIPGLVLILIAIGGALNMLLHTMLLLLAIVGIYLIIKGFGFEEDFFSRISDFLRSISIERISIVAYASAVVTLIIGVGLSYEEYLKEDPKGFVDMIKAAVTLTYADVILLSFVMAIAGRIIDEYSMKRYLAIRRYVILLALIVLVTLSAQAGANYLADKNTLMDLGIAVLLSVIFFIVVVKGTEVVFGEWISARRKWIKTYAGKKVVNWEGVEMGKVSRVLLDDFRLLGLKVGRKKIDRDSILSAGDRIVVKA